MKKITQDNYQQLEYNWEGIIVAYPKVDLYWNAEFYVYKQELDNNNEYIYKCCGYGKEDSVYNAFSGDWSKPDFKSCFGNWDKLTYYQFDDLKEFCEWYLHKDDKLKESIEKFIEETDKFYKEDWIQEKCGTNTPPTSVPKNPSVGNKKKVSLNDKLITERIERRNKEHYFMQKYGFNPYEQDPPEKLCYWEIYKDEKCDEELKRIIERKWPQIKNLLKKEILTPMSEVVNACISNKIPEDIIEQLKDQANPVLAYYKHGDGSENNLYSPNEIRDKINPGWNTRREQLKDVLKLLELRDRRQSTLETLFDAKEPSLVEHLQNQLDRDEQRIEDFLNEVIK